VDEVIGKHEFITYALALANSGAVKGVEILTYRETYGHEVKLPKWRAQFLGKTVAAPVKIDSDIRNISGATLSCVHVTEGVRRLLYTHAFVLKNL
jgi:Na+-transporting NADH:ubiquinone oxidoreductase subunit NqrC